jgi:hypothetical protein
MAASEVATAAACVSVQTLYNAIKAHRDAGILFVAAAGNSGRNNDRYPSYPDSYGTSDVLCLMSHDSIHRLSSA